MTSGRVVKQIPSNTLTSDILAKAESSGVDFVQVSPRDPCKKSRYFARGHAKAAAKLLFHQTSLRAYGQWVEVSVRDSAIEKLLELRDKLSRESIVEVTFFPAIRSESDGAHQN